MAMNIKFGLELAQSADNFDRVEGLQQICSPSSPLPKMLTWQEHNKDQETKTLWCINGNARCDSCASNSVVLQAKDINKL